MSKTPRSEAENVEKYGTVAIKSRKWSETGESHRIEYPKGVCLSIRTRASILATMTPAILSRLEKLRDTQQSEYIPKEDRDWFWTTFKALKESGWHYVKAWDMTCFALEKHYGVHP